MTAEAVDVERVYCRRCQRLLPASDFYAGNRSTCRRCKVQRAAQRRKADPAATAEARRDERRRARLRSEAEGRMLRRVLTDAAAIWERLCRDDIEASAARGEFYALLSAAFRDLEDELQIPAGTGLEALTRRKSEGIHGNPRFK